MNLCSDYYYHDTFFNRFYTLYPIGNKNSSQQQSCGITIQIFDSVGRLTSVSERFPIKTRLPPSMVLIWDKYDKV